MEREAGAGKTVEHLERRTRDDVLDEQRIVRGGGGLGVCVGFVPFSGARAWAVQAELS